MTARKYHIVGLGAALVDVIANVTEDELTALGTPKGAMELVGPDEALALLEKISIHTHAAGGSAANTIAGTATLGLSSGFVGKVADGALASSARSQTGRRLCVSEDMEVIDVCRCRWRSHCVRGSATAKEAPTHSAK